MKLAIIYPFAYIKSGKVGSHLLALVCAKACPILFILNHTGMLSNQYLILLKVSYESHIDINALVADEMSFCSYEYISTTGCN